jgi:general secretion pathway protein J
MKSAPAARGFTLIELLTALLILSLLSLMSFRGLGAVLDARTRVGMETTKWQRIDAFYARFEKDTQLAAQRAVRSPTGESPAWIFRPESETGPLLEFSRIGSNEATDPPRRVGYGLNSKHQVELWLWPGLDLTPDAFPARYAVLDGVRKLEIQFLNAELAWVSAWPSSPRDPPIPRAVRLRIELAPDEEIVRIFALSS